MEVVGETSMRPVRRAPGRGSRKSEEIRPILTAIRQICIGLFCLSHLIALTTHGGVYPAAIAASTLMMVITFCVSYFALGQPSKSAKTFSWILRIWAVLIVYCLLQSLPLPGFVTGHPAWLGVSQFNEDAPHYISVAPGNVWSSLLPISYTFATALSALILFRTDEQVGAALRMFGLTGAALATFAIVQFALFPKALMFGAKEYYQGSLTAPFVNRNTAATFYGVTLVALICQFQRRYIPRLLDRNRRLWPSDVNGYWVGTLCVATAVTFAAPLLTNSRAGITSTAIGMGVYVIGMLVLPPPAEKGFGFPQALLFRRTTRLMLGAAGALVALSIFWLFAGRALLRAEIQGTEDGRFCVLPGIWRATMDNFWTGIGPGGFQVYFPAYRNPECGLFGFWEMAHNAYLDGFLAFGLPFPLILISGSIFLLRLLVRGVFDRRRMRPVVWAGIACFIIVLIHSTLDFSIQIPGFAAWSATFLALVMTICAKRTKHSQTSKQ